MYRKHNEVKSLTTVHFCNESYILLLYTGGLLQGAGVLVGHVIRSANRSTDFDVFVFDVFDVADVGA